jgi:hypothetical protein
MHRRWIYICLIIFLSCATGSTPLKKSNSWLIYSNEKEPELKKWAPQTVKIIFELVDGKGQLFYVINKKRANKSKKNKHWEFPGGRRDKDEPVSESLLRELREEDLSGVLPAAFMDALVNNRSLHFRNIILANRSHHTLFKANITYEEWKSLSIFWKGPHEKVAEVKGFLLLSASAAHASNKSLKGKWTPKSRKLLKAMEVL